MGRTGRERGRGRRASEGRRGRGMRGEEMGDGVIGGRGGEDGWRGGNGW